MRSLVISIFFLLIASSALATEATQIPEGFKLSQVSISSGITYIVIEPTPPRCSDGGPHALYREIYPAFNDVYWGLERIVHNENCKPGHFPPTLKSGRVLDK